MTLNTLFINISAGQGRFPHSKSREPLANKGFIAKFD